MKPICRWCGEPLKFTLKEMRRGTAKLYHGHCRKEGRAAARKSKPRQQRHLEKLRA